MTRGHGDQCQRLQLNPDPGLDAVRRREHWAGQENNQGEPAPHGREQSVATEAYLSNSGGTTLAVDRLNGNRNNSETSKSSIVWKYTAFLNFVNGCDHSSQVTEPRTTKQ